MTHSPPPIREIDNHAPSDNHEHASHDTLLAEDGPIRLDTMGDAVE